MTSRPSLHFAKMHGAGNDFVIVDLRHGAAIPDLPTVQRMSDRHRGVGCDQWIAIMDPLAAGSVAAYRIWNTDGSIAQQCGNGARCVAAWLRRDAREHTASRLAPTDATAMADTFVLDSPAGAIAVTMHADDDVELAMTVPAFAPALIPLAMPAERSSYECDVGGEVVGFGAAAMGNPHALIEVDDIHTVAVARIGPAMQACGLFPEGVNVGFAQVISRKRIGLRVFERGVGETLACGSGACAAVAILVRQGRVDRDVAVTLPGGTLQIRWPQDDAPVRMRGPTAFVFEGEWLP